MALGDRFVQKDWRDVYDLDKGGFEKGSWYPFRNVSRWMDMLDKRDTFNVSTEYDAPQDMNQQLTDLASQTASNIDSKTLSSFMEDLDGGASDMFYSGISSAPTQEAVDMARLQNPDLTGGAYGLDMKTGELMQDDPYVPGGEQFSLVDETAYTDLEGNPIYGPGTETIQTDRWYPGKGVKNIFSMLTGKQPFSNPFTTMEAFESNKPNTRLDQLVNSIKVPSVENQMYEEDYSNPNMSDYNGGY